MARSSWTKITLKIYLYEGVYFTVCILYLQFSQPTDGAVSNVLIQFVDSVNVLSVLVLVYVWNY